MRTAEVKVYNYSELNASAKETVKAWMYENGFFWAEDAHRSLRGLEDVFPGLNIHSSCFSDYPEVDHRTSQIDDVLLELSGNRLRTWLINNVTGYCMDDDILEPIRDFIKNPSKNVNMQDIIDECIEAWKSSVRSDVESQLSDEYIAEHCDANEYEFTEEGHLF